MSLWNLNFNSIKPVCSWQLDLAKECTSTILGCKTYQKSSNPRTSRKHYRWGDIEQFIEWSYSKVDHATTVDYKNKIYTSAHHPQHTRAGIHHQDIVLDQSEPGVAEYCQPDVHVSIGPLPRRIEVYFVLAN